MRSYNDWEDTNEREERRVGVPLSVITFQRGLKRKQVEGTGFTPTRDRWYADNDFCNF